MVENKVPVKIQVTAYSGYRANERPIGFILNKRKFDVVNIIDRWYEMEYDYYKVLADDYKIYLLKWHHTDDLWFLEKIIERSREH